jgi:hypothetical protein
MSDKPEWGTQEWHRLHPIYLSVEDMKKPKEELIANVRSTLTKLRGQLDDIAHGYGWKDRLETPQHGITLVISNLYHVLEEMKQVKK